MADEQVSVDPEAGATGTLDTIQARLQAIEEAAKSRATAIQNIPDQLTRQRDWIAKAIIWVFVAAIALGLLILLLEGLAQPYLWSSVATQSADLIKSTVLPIVTLVLGYYFGQSGKS
jgi:hypothetical protein